MSEITDRAVHEILGEELIERCSEMHVAPRTLFSLYHEMDYSPAVFRQVAENVLDSEAVKSTKELENHLLEEIEQLRELRKGIIQDMVSGEKSLPVDLESDVNE